MKLYLCRDDVLLRVSLAKGGVLQVLVRLWEIIHVRRGVPLHLLDLQVSPPVLRPWGVPCGATRLPILNGILLPMLVFTTLLSWPIILPRLPIRVTDLTTFLYILTFSSLVCFIQSHTYRLASNVTDKINNTFLKRSINVVNVICECYCSLLDAAGAILLLMSLMMYNGSALMATMTATFHAYGIVTTNERSGFSN
jgi:hypothetical protein